MSTIPGIYKKLHAIMSEANYIQKDKENPHFKYTYASEAAIKETLHGLFVKHKVVPTFSTCNQQATEIGRTSKGDPKFRTTLDLSYRFFDIEDGSLVEGTMCGAGVDGEDKGTYKAITGALKYCLTSQFIIPTGDDPENDNGEKKQAKEKPAHRESTSTAIGRPVQPAPFEQVRPNDLAGKSVTELLAMIKDETRLNDWEFNFVNETRGRLQKYRDRLKISEKQLSSLIKIAQDQMDLGAPNGHSDGFSADDFTA